jgi:hypothetical protein
MFPFSVLFLLALMRDEIRKTPHETPKTLETNILPNLGWDIDSRQCAQKGPGLRQHQERNDATLNKYTQIWAVRNKIRKTVHETEKMIKISIPATLCRDIDSKQFLRKLPEARQHLEHNDTTLNTHTQTWHSRAVIFPYCRVIMILLTFRVATGYPTSHMHVATQSQGVALWGLQIIGAIGMALTGLTCLVMLRKTLQHIPRMIPQTPNTPGSSHHATSPKKKKVAGGGVATSTQTKMATQNHAQNNKAQNNQHASKSVYFCDGDKHHARQYTNNKSANIGSRSARCSVL